MRFPKMFGLAKKQEKCVPRIAGFVSESDLCHDVKEESDGSYVIRSVEDMYWLANMVNEKGYNFSGRTVRLVANIDFKGMIWTPIGRMPGKAFCGIFDGCGYILSGIQVKGEERYAGLFGIISGVNKLFTAEVYNLRLSSVVIRSECPDASVGGIVGFAYEGVRIEKCYVGGIIQGCQNTGGIAGKIEDCVTVRRCGSQGKIGGGEYNGAIVGKMQSDSTVINCHNVAMDLSGRPEEKLVGIWDDTSLIS